MIPKLKAFSCACMLICMATYLQPAIAQPSREQSRSMVMTQYGIVATSQAVASQAGAAILARGGNAVDAAIAANAALGVIEPMMNGVGGDLFAIVYDAKTKELYGLNASGWAPKAMTIEALKAKGIVKQIPDAGILSVTRKLAVILHSMWRNGQRFPPFPQAARRRPELPIRQPEWVAPQPQYNRQDGSEAARSEQRFGVKVASANQSRARVTAGKGWVAHILVCFLAYVLWKTLSQWCQRAGLGDEPRKIFAELQQISLVDVVLPTRTGVSIRKRCVSHPPTIKPSCFSGSACKSLPHRICRFVVTTSICQQ